ncbi:glucan biosynthesis protein D [Rhodobacterales bacterium HKCCE2091]|nr:glucan biosynthesis protein D [Rhodobacterales bacterium HKCCE2091]
MLDQRYRPGRRRVLAGLSALALAAALPPVRPLRAQEVADGDLPEPVPFSFDWLTEEMRAAAAREPVTAAPLEGFFADLHYDDYHRIQFRRDRMRWAEPEADSRFRLNAFHVGWLYNEPVQMHEVVDGQAVPMQFTTADFAYGELNEDTPTALELPGVAGFRLLNALNRADHFDELAAFLGASYFRALGRGNRYGLSARGLAVNTGISGSEEFPRFSDFWIERPLPGSDSITLHAALRSASVTGAFRFVVAPGEDTVMEVTARLFIREDIEQIGIAPLTSMYLFGGADPGEFFDFRPAVHDSEALVITTADGGTLFRALANPPRLASSYIGAQSPRSFGLVQRDRAFESYLDAQAHYELRPSLVVEPIGDWGRGTVRLLEIPSDLEANDNIVAYWIPDAPARAGDEIELSYRLHWGMTPPGSASSEHARILRTRVGEGGVSGVETDTGGQKFVIDFEGGLIAELDGEADVVPAVSAQRGEITEVVLSKVEGENIWRLVIEAEGEPGGSVELSARLTGFGRDLSETWLYQWVIA